MQLNPLASWLLVISYVVMQVLLLALVGMLVWALVRMNNVLESYRARLEPLLEKADQTLSVVTERVTVIGDKAESILKQGEEVATTVHEKVDQTASAVQRTVNAPFIGVNSLGAGLTRGFHTFTSLQKQKPGPENGTGQIVRETTEADAVNSPPLQREN